MSGSPDFQSSVQLIVWALLAGPIIGLLAAAYVRLIFLSGQCPLFPTCSRLGVRRWIGARW